jgi:hypothetical protein
MSAGGSFSTCLKSGKTNKMLEVRIVVFFNRSQQVLIGARRRDSGTVLFLDLL